MLLSFAQFLACSDIGVESLLALPIEYVNAYASYLRGGGGALDGCSLHVSSRGHSVHDRLLESCACDLLGVSEWCAHAVSDPEALDSVCQGCVRDDGSGDATVFTSDGAGVGRLRNATESGGDVNRRAPPRGDHDSVLQSSGADYAANGTDGAKEDFPLAGAGRGSNYARNKANRDAKKRRKMLNKRREVDVNTGGFWNSCSEDMRRQLIDSKARMHVADNLRRAKESELRASELGSPYEMMTRAVRMADYAEKQGARASDNGIYGWAKTVASSSAESLARSVPSSVPSFSELNEKLAASSQSSFDLELANRDLQITALKEQVAELRLKNEIERKNSSILDASRVGNQKFLRPVEPFIPKVKHRVLTRDEVYAEY